MRDVSRDKPTFRDVVELARRQWGIVTLADIVALGFPDWAAREWVRSGRLIRLYRGVYAVGHDALHAEGRWLAAVWACGEGAALSFAAACALHELRPMTAALIDVSVPAERRKRRGIRPHQTTFLPGDVTTVSGIPVTSPTRTIIDMAALLRPSRLENLLALAERRGILDHDRLGLSHCRKLRAVLAAEPQLTRSEDEAILLAALRQAGLPEPEMNAWITHGGGEEWQGDLVYHDVRLIIEIDDDSHKTAAAFELDREKDTIRQDDGWTTRRFTRRQVRERLPWVVGRIAAAYSALRNVGLPHGS